MIDLYTWTTPNGRKVSILLEELGIPYTPHAIDIGKNEQFAPDFLAISPNNKIPAIFDHETGRSVMESGAILMYLATKYNRFLGTGDNYWPMMEWLMWQMGGLGPMLGQVHHFVKYNKGVSDYSADRFSTEASRLYSVLNKRLEGRDYVANEYTIADMAIWPWVSRFEWQEIDLNQYPNVLRWYTSIAQRPAVQRGYHVPSFVSEIPMP